PDADTYDTDDNVSVTYSYANIGTKDATSFDRQIWLNDTLVATLTSDPLAVGDSMTQTYSFGNLAAGTYTVRIVLDSADAVNESDLTNNLWSETFTVNVIPTMDLAMVAPDGWISPFVISADKSTTCTQTEFSTEDDLYIRYAFRNDGNTAITDSYGIQFSRDDRIFATLTPGTLEAGGWIEKTFCLGPFSEGTYTLRLVLDVADVISETDESNNEFSVTITVINPAGKPDLTAMVPEGWSDALVVSTDKSTAEDRTTFTIDEYLYVRYAFGNIGGADLTRLCYIQMYLYSADVSRAPASLGTVCASRCVANGVLDSYAPRVIGPLSVGTYTLQLVLDTKNSVDELDETNNVYTKTFTVYNPAGKSDLTPAVPEGWDSPIVLSDESSVSTTQSVFYSDDSIYVQYAYGNIGGADLAHLCICKLALHSQESELKTWAYAFSILASGGIKTRCDSIAIGSLPAGTYTLTLTIDTRDTVDEDDETNNECSVTFTVIDRETETSVTAEENAVLTDNAFAQLENEAEITSDDDGLAGTDVCDPISNEIVIGPETVVGDTTDTKSRNESLDYLYSEIGDDEEDDDDPLEMDLKSLELVL
ncbi:MAG: CARDB domain-containing protein, partial [Planctomycetia bacterium]|nr:CARDB domain-containing protein [Planctomycetia bacterium]